MPLSKKRVQCVFCGYRFYVQKVSKYASVSVFYLEKNPAKPKNKRVDRTETRLGPKMDTHNGKRERG